MPLPLSASRLFLLLILLCSSQLSAQTDTLYVQKYDNNLVPRLFTNYKYQSTAFITRTDTSYSADHFTTGDQHFIGAEIGYRWASLGYSFGFNRENSLANTDLRFSTSLRAFRFQLNYTSLRNLRYYRIDGLRQEDTAFIVRQRTIALRNAGLKVDYVLNNRKCYYASSLAQSGRQLRSQGSFILSSGISYQDFNLRGMSDSTGSLFYDRYGADRFKTMRADLGLGYTYNWVLARRLVLSVSDIPNLGFQQLYISRNAQEKQRFTVSFTNYVRSGITYTWNNMFAGVYVYNVATAGKWSGYNYNNSYTSFQFHFGWVLGDPKRYIKKVTHSG